MKTNRPKTSLAIVNLLAAVLVLPLLNYDASAQSTDVSSKSPTGSRNPISTIKVEDTRFDYYDNPPVVAGSSTFYLSGSHGNSLVFDFVALTVAFGNRGRSLRQPSEVNFHFVTATYRDGCKIRDRYAVGDKLRIALVADDVSINEIDLALTGVNETKTRNGRMCMELYWFQVPFDSLTTLAAARKATFVLGPRSLGFQRKHLAALKVLIDGIGKY